jgi:hypothetical protein
VAHYVSSHIYIGKFHQEHVLFDQSVNETNDILIILFKFFLGHPQINSDVLQEFKRVYNSELNNFNTDDGARSLEELAEEIRSDRNDPRGLLEIGLKKFITKKVFGLGGGNGVVNTKADILVLTILGLLGIPSTTTTPTTTTTTITTTTTVAPIR